MKLLGGYVSAPVVQSAPSCSSCQALSNPDV